MPEHKKCRDVSVENINYKTFVQQGEYLLHIAHFAGIAQ